ncbi:MAG: YkgJ family cysteine cluster protein [Phycisphaerae bacterium]|nr:YkgJ family cysteine cluster protein [Phycisphaerae bacterium]
MALMDTEDILRQLDALYRRMDRAYADMAEAIGLVCEGCEDTCCLTHFHHHTVVEWLHLSRGLELASPGLRRQLIDRAQALAGEGDGDGPGVCPLYEGGQCALYEHRPLICRLHGLPWTLKQGRNAGELRPGCHRAAQCLASRDSQPILDRTPFYLEMASLECRARELTGREDRINMTVAEMIAEIAQHRGW